MNAPASRVLLTALAVAVALASIGLLPACTGNTKPERGEADGATLLSLTTTDDLTLDGRLWQRDSGRLVIYLHEFREDQSAWWSVASASSSISPSILTFDFRGHGRSEGELDDVEGMLFDVYAAVDFARDRGFGHVMLVGAGMGAAVGVVAAVDIPDVTVIGFSTPADFDVLEPVSVLPALGDRVRLIAARDDISAADSLRKFRTIGGLDATQAHLYPGTSHGVELLEDDASNEIRRRFEEYLETLWIPFEA